MKNIIDNLSPKAIRIWFTLFVLIVLGISIFNFANIMYYKTTGNDQCAWLPIKGDMAKFLISDIVPGGVADQAGLKNGDILLHINGKPFRNGDEAMLRISNVPIGGYATYLVDRNGYQFETKVYILKVFNVNYFSLFILGLGFLIVGYIVLITKPKGKTQQSFGLYSLFLMFYLGLGGLNVNPQTDPMWQVIILIASFCLSRIIAPPQFVNFYINFPYKKNLKFKKMFIGLLYLISALWVALLVYYNFSGKAIPFVRIFILIPDLFVVIGFIFFIHGYLKIKDIQRRKQLRPILYSIIIIICLFIYIQIITTADPFAVFLQPSLLLPALLYILVPFAFGYSIFKYRLMDTELIIKRSLIYGIITASIAAIYLLCVFGLGSLLGLVLGQSENQVLTVLAFLVIAFAFDPFKQRLQIWIDKIFYREKYNYHKVLLEFSKELPRKMNLEQILNSMLVSISNTMHVEKIAIILCDDKEGCHCVNKNIDQVKCEFGESENGLLSFLRKNKIAQSFALLARDPEVFQFSESDKKKLIDAGIVLIVPMFLQDRMIGMINVGEKLSGKIYSQEDIDLLSTVASQAAIAIENARLHLSEMKRKLMEEELAMARKIQEGLLPKENPVIKGLDISGISLPALSVGGDYFDFIQINPNKLLVAVADVSGKGMSAALYMSKVQGMVQLAAYLYHSPKDILIEVNRRIYDNIERKSFITMILALFDLEKKTVKICRAGHNKPLIRTNGKFEYVGSEGIGLGLEKGPIFESKLEEIELPVRRNSIFIFYSDGLNEAMDIRLKEFGEKKIYDIVSSNNNLNANEIQKAITTAVEEHRGSAEQNDDLTLVVIKSE